MELCYLPTTATELFGGFAIFPNRAKAFQQSHSVCDYCQEDQIWAVAALLAANPGPTDDESYSVTSDNPCRCCTYGLWCRKRSESQERSIRAELEEMVGCYLR